MKTSHCSLVKKIRACRFVLPMVLAMVASHMAVNGASFTPIGQAGSAAYGVSADGSIVVGSRDTPSPAGVIRWTQSSGAVVLPVVQNQNGGLGISVTTNGLMVVGSVATSGGQRGFIWTPGGGSVTYNGGFVNTSFHGVSGDGAKIIGLATGAPNNHLGFAYYPLSGNSFALPGFNDYPYPFPGAISEDGSVVVGSCFNGSVSRATAWSGTVIFVPVSLGVLPGTTTSTANAVSKDGNVIVGVSGGRAFRWTQAGGMSDIGAGTAYGVSGDGGIVVGFGNDATIWDATNGSRNLLYVLTNSYGLNAALNGWRLTVARAISTDGSTIVGDGINPQGQTQGWRAQLTPDIRLQSARQQGTKILFEATGLTMGKMNVLESSSNLTSWISVQTNVAPGVSMSFTNQIDPGQNFFRLYESP